MPKPLLSDKSWEWASSVTDTSKLTKEQFRLAYKLQQECCFFKSKPCKRNCRYNPRCLCGIGEKKWLNAAIDQNWSDNLNPYLEKRKTGQSCGLKNLGATCYVNSLLQVLFHNLHFRKAIYMWKPEEDPSENPDKKDPEKFIDSLESFEPKSPIGYLQLIFAKLQFSYNLYIDPEPLVKCLNLDVSLQQDAQEFCKLFLNLLEDDLSKQSNNSVKKIVQNQYRGEYEYTTRCHGCGYESRSPSTFYELSVNISGHKSVQGCLQEFFAPEAMEGSDQYHCVKCKKMQNATRTVRLTKLPPTLNLQLMRFVYDRQKGCKKKINSPISFTETLEINQEFLAKDAEPPKAYQLCAVLVHVGKSAHSGHYVAHIKDSKSGIWYKFNDELVEKIQGNSLKENLDDSGDEIVVLDAAGDVEPTARKLPKGSLSSKNAYMLVYKDSQHDLKEKSTLWDQILPEYLASAICQEQSQFDAMSNDYKQLQDANVARLQVRQKQIQETFRKLQLTTDCKYDWISKDWLIKWLQADKDEEIPQINNSSALCPHDKLSLNSIPNMKCVNSEGADLLYDHFHGGPRLRDDSVLCEACVIEAVNEIQLSNQLQIDQRRVASLSKATLLANEDSYWVGKESFRCWKQLASEQDERIDEPYEEEVDDPEIQVVKTKKLNFKFNEDLLCCHGRLTCDESRRKLVSYKIWEIMKKYFKDTKDFVKTSESCTDCQDEWVKNENVKNLNRTAAQEQKQSLRELYSLTRRPSIHDNDRPDEQVTYYAVSRDFFKQWQNFIRDASHYEPPVVIDNLSLVCDTHQGLIVDVLKESDSLDSKLVLLHEKEWSYIANKYQCNLKISFQLLTGKVEKGREEESETEAVSGSKKLVSEPPFCSPCHRQLIEKELEEKLTYTKATIFVRKVQTKEEAEDIHETQINGDDDNSDKPFPASSGSGYGGKDVPKKLKLNNISEKDRERLLFSSEITTASAASSSQPRRSSRRRKYRDEHEFVVSSQETLKDLKVKIMDKFKVATYDQHLSVNDVPLENNDKTLAELNVYPDSFVLLRVDEAPCNGNPLEEDEDDMKGRPEQGFKGTQLQKS
ncbi:Ubiquitin carboxyl-terminal hydrolase 48 [Halotydeus destructor]|nr:Ubiquitin carboxyl-terminal hydrolase 48 [Halotydeus destructor]